MLSSSKRLSLSALILVMLCNVLSVRAQQMAESSSLPDAPASSTASAVSTSAARPAAGYHQRYIAAGETEIGHATECRSALGQQTDRA